jgi:hypothetical protein
MKTRKFGLSLLLTGATFLMMSSSLFGQEVEKLNATYAGVTDDDQFKFKDANKQDIYFLEMSEDVEIDLYDDEFTGTLFKITWMNQAFDVLDEEGEPTGATEKHKVILTLEEVK